MTASREERAYRRSAKKCTRGEAKTRLLEDLLRKRLGLREVEEFVKKERKTFMGGGKEEKFNSRISKHKEERCIVDKIMRRKLKGNNDHCKVLRREKVKCDESLVAKLGGKTREYRRVVRETRKNCDELRSMLKGKNDKKIKWLQMKYEEIYEYGDDMTEEEYEMYGMAKILCGKNEITAEKLREPEVVVRGGEELTVTEEEKEVLALGPKFCVRKSLKMEDFEIEMEECIAKIKWWLREEEEKGNTEKDPGDVAIMAILPDEEREEVEEHEEMKEASRRLVYHPEEKKWNFGRKRATDLKGNTMVVLPGRSKNFQFEANLEMLRAELKGCFKDYVGKNCNKRG